AGLPERCDAPRGDRLGDAEEPEQDRGRREKGDRGAEPPDDSSPRGAPQGGERAGGQKHETGAAPERQDREILREVEREGQEDRRLEQEEEGRRHRVTSARGSRGSTNGTPPGRA